MAKEKITFGRVLKDLSSQNKHIGKYLLFTLVILALAFVNVFLSSTDYSIIGVILLVALILPLIVSFTEYTAFVESGAPYPQRFNGFVQLFRHTYLSGRLRLVFTWKVLFGYLLYVFVAMFVVLLGFSGFISIFDKPLLTEYMRLMQTVLELTSAEAMNALALELFELFSPYLNSYVIVTQLLVVGGLIFIINRAIFKIYVSVFIEHQPTTKYETISAHFFSDRPTKKTLRKMETILLFASLLLYGLVYGGSFLILQEVNPNGLLGLQTELLGLLVLVPLLPFATRFNYYLYQRIMAPKREAVLRFAISELRGIMNNPLLPEQTRGYIEEVLKMRQKELDALSGIIEHVEDPPETSAAIDEE